MYIATLLFGTTSSMLPSGTDAMVILLIARILSEEGARPPYGIDCLFLILRICVCSEASVGRTGAKDDVLFDQLPIEVSGAGRFGGGTGGGGGPSICDRRISGGGLRI